MAKISIIDAPIKQIYDFLILVQFKVGARTKTKAGEKPTVCQNHGMKKSGGNNLIVWSQIQQRSCSTHFVFWSDLLFLVAYLMTSY